MKHTPGPWHSAEAERGIGFNVYAQEPSEYASPGELMIVADHLTPGNARLIAAAPDLLALLVESQTSIGGNWRERRDDMIAKLANK